MKRVKGASEALHNAQSDNAANSAHIAHWTNMANEAHQRLGDHNDTATEDELDEAQENIKRYSHNIDTARLQEEYERAERALAQIRKEMPNMSEFKVLMSPADRLLTATGVDDERNATPYPPHWRARMYDSRLRSYEAAFDLGMRTRDAPATSNSRIADTCTTQGSLERGKRTSFNADNALDDEVRSYYGSPEFTVANVRFRRNLRTPRTLLRIPPLAS
jgi:hypothetical protein